jgi:hypothetical protein
LTTGGHPKGLHQPLGSAAWRIVDETLCLNIHYVWKSKTLVESKVKIEMILPDEISAASGDRRQAQV